MFNLINLKVKCPLCGTSLMDSQKKIDNEESIRANITIGGKSGTIWLSSIYESYNYDSDIEIPKDEVAQFFCPHCKQELKSQILCENDSAPMIPFHLIEGGKVLICSKAGCKKHSVEFEDLETALNHFYEKFSYIGEGVDAVHHPHKKHLKPKPSDAEEKEIISSGSFLHAFCPHCNNSLLEKNMLKFKIAKKDGESGFLMLSPYLNVFSHKSTIQLPEGTTIDEIKCFNCNHDLIVKDKDCPKCGEKVAKIRVVAMSKMIDFYICSKKGCTWHGLSNDDIKVIMLEDSEEW